MGYELHITRKENWYDEENLNEITLNEWLDYLNTDSTMRLDGFAEIELGNDKTFRMESDGLAIWMGYSWEGKDGNHAWFDYSNGNIVVKNPGQEIINKMCEIAFYFKAKVQGNEGELYEKAAYYEDSKVNRKPWWKFW